MKISFVRSVMACGVLVAVLIGSAEAQSATAADPSEPVKTKPKAKKKATKTAATGKRGNAKFLPGSQETPGQRSARLKRECKGAVNAGACEGYTR